MLVIALVVSLALIMYLISKKYSMGGAIILGGFILAILAGLSPSVIAGVFIKSLSSRQTLELVFSVYLIGVLSSIMYSYGVMDKMTEYLEKSFRSVKLLLFVVPSLLCTFNVAGSAIFAAPVIDALGDKVGLTKERKSAINLYVRHGWFFVLPISISLLYAAYLAEVSIWELIKAQALVSIISLISAYLVYINPIKDELIIIESQESRGQIIAKALLYTAPLLLCLLLVFWLPFYLALLICCSLTYLLKVKEADLKKVLLTKQSLNMAFAAAAIMVFKNIIDSIPGIRQIIQDVINQGLPMEVIIIVLSLVLGYVLANPQALVGTLYPILLPLVPQDQLLATAALINVMGFVAYYISPLHLCQALTNEYFCISTTGLYKEYKITVPLMFLAGMANYILWRLF